MSGSVQAAGAISFSSLVEKNDLKHDRFDISVVQSSRILDTNRPRHAAYNERSSASHYFPVFRKANRHTAPLYVARIPDARIEGTSLYVELSDRRLLAESVPHRRRDEQGVRLIQDEYFSKPTKSVDGSFISVGHEQGSNYFHWHIDCLFAMFLSQTEKHSVPVACSALSSWQAASLRHIGISEDKIFRLPPGITTVKELIWASPLKRDQFLMHPMVQEVFARIAASAGKQLEMGDYAERVYIARTDAKARQLRNEEALIEALRQRGYRIIVPSELSYEEQVLSCSRAKIIVGLHGAGLTNIGFASSKCRVIEIFPDIYMNTGFYGIVQVTGQPYYYYARSAGNGPAAASMQPAYWDLNVEDFLREYRDLL